MTNSAGQGIAGLSVQFSVTAGGGSVANPTATTDAQGRASSGMWTLGSQPGQQQLRATVSGVGSVTFTATATATPPTPAAIILVTGNGQSTEVATKVPLEPRVRVLDAQGDPISGVQVTFSVMVGGGSVSGGSVMTNGAGEAAPSAWTLGTAAGANQLRAAVSGIAPITFNATGTAGPAASVIVMAGDNQTAEVSTDVPVDPLVQVSDAHGNAVSAANVTFAVSSGGGSASGTTSTTDGSGLASVGSWTLGVAPGANSLTATVSGSGITGNPLTFAATGTPGGGGGGGGGGAYNIEIRFNPGSNPTAAQQLAYQVAEAKLESIITGDVPDAPVNRPAGTCSSATAINETIDDIVIWVTLEAIDGAGGVLGSAGPCLIRSGTLLPIAGSMRFDIADLANLEASGLLEEVILHEMGHVLGIGTLWGSLGLLADPVGSGGTDPRFTGTQSIAAFNAIGGAAYAGPKVPVEAGGGPGTYDGHWRESIFDKELMTGWVDPGTNPLSLLTIESLDDIGYEVDETKADPYTVTITPNLIPVGPGSAVSFQLVGDILDQPIEILGPDGRPVGLITR